MEPDRHDVDPYSDVTYIQTQWAEEAAADEGFEAIGLDTAMPPVVSTVPGPAAVA
jgi:hypothetical protein